VYMRRYSSVTSTKEADEVMLRRDRSLESPTMETGILGRTIPHAPVTSQSWSRSYSQQPLVGQVYMGWFINTGMGRGRSSLLDNLSFIKTS
ncbi:hypothetical protein XENOCAPTIV_021505, partial [Xenoophorus captivus]